MWPCVPTLNIETTSIIQINAKNSTDVSDYGVNDVSSLDKTITAVVTMSFSIE